MPRKSQAEQLEEAAEKVRLAKERMQRLAGKMKEDAAKLHKSQRAIIGEALMGLAQSDPEAKAWLAQRLDLAVTKERDRNLIEAFLKA